MDPAQKSPQPIPVILPPVGLESTEIPLTEAKKLEHAGTKKKRKRFIIAGGIVLFLILFGILGFLAIKMATKQPPPQKKIIKPTPTPIVSTVLLIDKKNHDQVIVGFVPHFLDLKLSDLPNVHDIRGIFNYKKNLIIIASTGIIEYNPKTNDIIRQNDQRLFQCINYATVIENKLYIACNGTTRSAGIYVINLDTGTIEKTYKPGSANLTFASVTNIGDTLWVGAKNMIVTINTKTDTIQEFSPKDVGITGCQYFMIHAYEKALWTTCISPTTAAVALYDKTSNTWTSYPSQDNSTDPIYTLGYSPKALYFLSYTTNPSLYTYDLTTRNWTSTASAGLQIPSSTPLAQDARIKLQDDAVIFPGIEQKGIAYLSYYNSLEKKVKDFELALSDYTGVSDIVAEKRYLFTHSAIDSVKEKQFPASFKKLTSQVGLGTKAFVDPFENYAVLVGSSSASTPPFTTHLIDMKKGTVTDLMLNNKSLTYIDPEVFQQFIKDLPTTRLFGTAKDATLVEGKTGNEIMKIDFSEKTMTFNRY